MEKAIEKRFSIMGISLPVFAVIVAVVLAGTFMGVLPADMVGAFALMFIIGSTLEIIGNKTPIVKDYLGGGPIVIIFGSAALVMYKILPQYSLDAVTALMKTNGFLDFYIAALIAGSILGMNRKLLIKAAIGYMPAILGGVITALALVGVTGAVLGYGYKEAILFVGIPIMGGGMGAGAVPLAKIFGMSMNKDAAEVLSMMVPAVALGNAMAIVVAGILDKIGKSKPSLTGNGELMANNSDVAVDKEEHEPIDYKIMSIGILISTSFYIFGSIISKFIPSVHTYAWMIISVALVKTLGLLPRKYEMACAEWYQFVMKNFTAVLLVGIGVAYTDLGTVISSLNLTYIILVGVTIVGATIGSGFAGKFVGFYPVEASITAGLCMANMGGTGDVAVLSAANRMKLMPFAAISSRLGGAIILIIASFIMKLL